MTDVQVLSENLQSNEINPTQNYLKNNDNIEKNMAETTKKTLKSNFKSYVNLVVETWMETR